MSVSAKAVQFARCFQQPWSKNLYSAKDLRGTERTERIFGPDLVLHQARQTLRELINLTGLYTKITLVKWKKEFGVNCIRQEI
jgi:hypothetical protein